MVHSARPARTSRISFASSGRSGACDLPGISSECKEDLLQIGSREAGARAQVGERADAAGAAVGPEDEAVADALRIRQLMDGQDQGPALRGCLAEHAADRA